LNDVCTLFESSVDWDVCGFVGIFGEAVFGWVVVWRSGTGVGHINHVTSTLSLVSTEMSIQT